MKSLQLYRDQLGLIKKQRDALDEDMAQVLAEGTQAGHSILDLLLPVRPDVNQKGFDL